MTTADGAHLRHQLAPDDALQIDLTPDQRVLRVAETLFLDRGYRATTIRDIAKSSKVSNRTIVKYFSSKQRLFVCIVGEITARILGAATIDIGDLPEKGLKTWGAAVLRLQLEPRMVTAAQHLYSEVFTLPDLVQSYYETGPGKLAAILSFQLKHWADEGLFPQQDFLAAANWFLHLLSGGVYRRVMMGLQSAASDSEIEQTVNDTVRIFMISFGQMNTTNP